MMTLYYNFIIFTIALDAVIIRNRSHSAIDISSESTKLACKPIFACGSSLNITWERVSFNGKMNSTLGNKVEQPVDAEDYGNYTCIVTGDRFTYSLYGKIVGIVWCGFMLSFKNP